MGLTDISFHTDITLHTGIARIKTILQRHDIIATNLVELLLFGHTSFSDSENRDILNVILDFNI